MSDKFFPNSLQKVSVETAHIRPKKGSMRADVSPTGQNERRIQNSNQLLTNHHDSQTQRDPKTAACQQHQSANQHQAVVLKADYGVNEKRKNRVQAILSSNQLQLSVNLHQLQNEFMLNNRQNQAAPIEDIYKQKSPRISPISKQKAIYQSYQNRPSIQFSNRNSKEDAPSALSFQKGSNQFKVKKQQGAKERKLKVIENMMNGPNPTGQDQTAFVVQSQHQTSKNSAREYRPSSFQGQSNDKKVLQGSKESQGVSSGTKKHLQQQPAADDSHNLNRQSNFVPQTNGSDNLSHKPQSGKVKKLKLTQIQVDDTSGHNASGNSAAQQQILGQVPQIKKSQIVGSAQIKIASSQNLNSAAGGGQQQNGGKNSCGPVSPLDIVTTPSQQQQNHPNNQTGVTVSQNSSKNNNGGRQQKLTTNFDDLKLLQQSAALQKVHMSQQQSTTISSTIQQQQAKKDKSPSTQQYQQYNSNKLANSAVVSGVASRIANQEAEKERMRRKLERPTVARMLDFSSSHTVQHVSNSNFNGVNSSSGGGVGTGTGTGTQGPSQISSSMPQQMQQQHQWQNSNIDLTKNSSRQLKMQLLNQQQASQQQMVRQRLPGSGSVSLGPSSQVGPQSVKHSKFTNSKNLLLLQSEQTNPVPIIPYPHHPSSGPSAAHHLHSSSGKNRLIEGGAQILVTDTATSSKIQNKQQQRQYQVRNYLNSGGEHQSQQIQGAQHQYNTVDVLQQQYQTYHQEDDNIQQTSTTAAANTLLMSPRFSLATNKRTLPLSSGQQVGENLGQHQQMATGEVGGRNSHHTTNSHTLAVLDQDHLSQQQKRASQQFPNTTKTSISRDIHKQNNVLQLGRNSNDTNQQVAAPRSTNLNSFIQTQHQFGNRALSGSVPLSHHQNNVHSKQPQAAHLIAAGQMMQNNSNQQMTTQQYIPSSFLQYTQQTTPSAQQEVGQNGEIISGQNSHQTSNNLRQTQTLPGASNSNPFSTVQTPSSYQQANPINHSNSTNQRDPVRSGIGVELMSSSSTNHQAQNSNYKYRGSGVDNASAGGQQNGVAGDRGLGSGVATDSYQIQQQQNGAQQQQNQQFPVINVTQSQLANLLLQAAQKGTFQLMPAEASQLNSANTTNNGANQQSSELPFVSSLFNDQQRQSDPLRFDMSNAKDLEYLQRIAYNVNIGGAVNGTGTGTGTGTDSQQINQINSQHPHPIHYVVNSSQNSQQNGGNVAQQMPQPSMNNENQHDFNGQQAQAQAQTGADLVTTTTTQSNSVVLKRPNSRNRTLVSRTVVQDVQHTTDNLPPNLQNSSISPFIGGNQTQILQNLAIKNPSQTNPNPSSNHNHFHQAQRASIDLTRNNLPPQHQHQAHHQNISNQIQFQSLQQFQQQTPADLLVNNNSTGGRDSRIQSTGSNVLNGVSVAQRQAQQFMMRQLQGGANEDEGQQQAHHSISQSSQQKRQEAPSSHQQRQRFELRSPQPQTTKSDMRSHYENVLFSPQHDPTKMLKGQGVQQEKSGQVPPFLHQTPQPSHSMGLPPVHTNNTSSSRRSENRQAAIQQQFERLTAMNQMNINRKQNNPNPNQNQQPVEGVNNLIQNGETEGGIGGLGGTTQSEIEGETAQKVVMGGIAQRNRSAHNHKGLSKQESSSINFCDTDRQSMQSGCFNDQNNNGNGGQDNNRLGVYRNSHNLNQQMMRPSVAAEYQSTTNDTSGGVPACGEFLQNSQRGAAGGSETNRQKQVIQSQKFASNTKNTSNSASQQTQQHQTPTPLHEKKSQPSANSAKKKKKDGKKGLKSLKTTEGMNKNGENAHQFDSQGAANQPDFVKGKSNFSRRNQSVNVGGYPNAVPHIVQSTTNLQNLKQIETNQAFSPNNGGDRSHTQNIQTQGGPQQQQQSNMVPNVNVFDLKRNSAYPQQHHQYPSSNQNKLLLSHEAQQNHPKGSGQNPQNSSNSAAQQHEQNPTTVIGSQQQASQPPQQHQNPQYMNQMSLGGILHQPQNANPQTSQPSQPHHGNLKPKMQLNKTSQKMQNAAGGSGPMYNSQSMNSGGNHHQMLQGQQAAGAPILNHINHNLAHQTTSEKPSAPPVVVNGLPQASIEANQKYLGEHGLFMKNVTSCCQKYFKSANNSRMTPRKYRDGVSSRVLVAKETFSAKRAKLPILVVNLDGVLGYWDEAKTYNMREKSLGLLISLSHNFRIVGYSSETKTLLKQLGKLIAANNQRPFIFDCLYQIAKRPQVSQQFTNFSQIILDFSPEEEDDLNMFISASMVILTAEKVSINQTFDTMDLREIFDFDKEYLEGPKAPLIIRVPHARLRNNQCLAFEAAFQVLICILITSSLKNLETCSFFSYNERTKHISLPMMADKVIIPHLLPEKLKFMEKAVQQSKSARFAMHEPPHGLHLHKGFKMLTECYLQSKPEWLDFKYRVYKPLLPIRMRLQKITQNTLQGAIPPTGKKLQVRCLGGEEANKKYMNFQKKNEVIKKHVRKYRARYWACNQIEEADPQVCEVDDDAVEEEDEQIGIEDVDKMGKTKSSSGFTNNLQNTTKASNVDKKEDLLVKNAEKNGEMISDGEKSKGGLVAHGNDVDQGQTIKVGSGLQKETGLDEDQTTDTLDPLQKDKHANIAQNQPSNQSQSLAKTTPKDTSLSANSTLNPQSQSQQKEENALPQKEGNGECSSSDGSNQSEGEEQYDGDALPIKFKVIDIQLVDGEKEAGGGGGNLRKQQGASGQYNKGAGGNDPHKMVKFECRKLAKPKHQFLIDFCSKKQNTMMFQTSQPQHLQGAIAQQVESQIAELVSRLNDLEKKGHKDIVNYDF